MTVPTAKQRRERQIRADISQRRFRRRQKEERHEYDTKIKNGLVHLHRQMDTQGFVFARRKSLDGIENGEEDIFPDPMSQSVAEGWRNGAPKALECQFAAFVPGAAE